MGISPYRPSYGTEETSDEGHKWVADTVETANYHHLKAQDGDIEELKHMYDRELTTHELKKLLLRNVKKSKCTFYLKINIAKKYKSWLMK